VDTNKRKLILVTNDDGVHAKGMAALIEAVKNFGDVVAVAPHQSQSGMSHALTLKTPLRLKQMKRNDSVTVYELNGTPVDCVKMAFDKILPRKPDLLVSGINHGSNSSLSSIYSGTVAAAREGAINSIKSIAFSNLDYSDDANFDFIQPIVRKIVEDVLENGLSTGTFLNVNVPHFDPSKLKGIRICRQARGVWVEEFEKRVDPIGANYYWLTGYFDNFEPDAEDTDEWALKNNYVSVVPLSFENCDFKAVNDLMHRFN